jgi:hypothetical protein
MQPTSKEGLSSHNSQPPGNVCPPYEEALRDCQLIVRLVKGSSRTMGRFHRGVHRAYMKWYCPPAMVSELFKN